MTVDGIKTSIRLHNLKKYTTYFVWVSASTSVREGPMSEKHTFSTAEDGECNLGYVNTGPDPTGTAPNRTGPDRPLFTLDRSGTGPERIQMNPKLDL